MRLPHFGDDLHSHGGFAARIAFPGVVDPCGKVASVWPTVQLPCGEAAGALRRKNADDVGEDFFDGLKCSGRARRCAC